MTRGWKNEKGNMRDKRQSGFALEVVGICEENELLFSPSSDTPLGFI